MPAFYRLIGWGYASVCTALALSAWSARERLMPPAPRPVARVATPVVPAPRAVTRSTAADAAEWFRKIKPYCNSVEITTVKRDMPPPPTIEGAGYHASCLALAGRIDDARRAIDDLD